MFARTHPQVRTSLEKSLNEKQTCWDSLICQGCYDLIKQARTLYEETQMIEDLDLWEKTVIHAEEYVNNKAARYDGAGRVLKKNNADDAEDIINSKDVKTREHREELLRQRGAIAQEHIKQKEMIRQKAFREHKEKVVTCKNNYEKDDSLENFNQWKKTHYALVDFCQKNGFGFVPINAERLAFNAAQESHDKKYSCLHRSSLWCLSSLMQVRSWCGNNEADQDEEVDESEHKFQKMTVN